jgi:hypothetical protein
MRESSWKKGPQTKVIPTFVGFNCGLAVWIYPEYQRRDAVVQLWLISETKDHR